MWMKIVGYAAYAGMVSGAIFGTALGALSGLLLPNPMAVLIVPITSSVFGAMLGTIFGGSTGLILTSIIRLRFYSPHKDDTDSRILGRIIIFTSMAVTLLCVGIVLKVIAANSLPIGEWLWNTLVIGFVPAIYAGICAAYSGKTVVNFVARENSIASRRDQALSELVSS